MELQPILHVWVSHDNDLVNLTITHTIKQGKAAKPGSEVIHTNKKHPFLTVEEGFLPVGQITLGMHVVEANGQTGVVSGWKVVPGVMTMYNLEVAQDHTFVVGAGMWVVHNCGIDDAFLPKNRYPEAASTLEEAREAGQPSLNHWDPDLADFRRAGSLRPYPTQTGFDRDEYPMASTQEGGAGAYVKYINPSDNRGAGRFIANQMRGVPNGTPFTIHIIDEWLF